MTEQTDYNSIPLDELEKMVAGIPTSQMDTENPAPQEEPKEEPEQSNGDVPHGESKETGEEPKGEPEQQEEQQTDGKGEPEKKTPESIKKLLHQRSELRQDNDRLKTELDEAKELIRKLRS
jgi:flagellar motility protein MotE (MotC chaperone)